MLGEAFYAHGVGIVVAKIAQQYGEFLEFYKQFSVAVSTNDPFDLARKMIMINYGLILIGE